MQCSLWLGLVVSCVVTCSTVEAVEKWGVLEVAVQSADAPHTIDSAFTATFTQGTQNISVPSFWDGGEEFKIRFSPPSEGEWSYTTHSKYKSLDGKTGVLMVEKPSVENHGPVYPIDTFYLQHADGTPYHQFGTTCYAWVHQARIVAATNAGNAGSFAVQQDSVLRLPEELPLQPKRAAAFCIRKASRWKV